MGQGREAIPVAIIRHLDLKAPEEDFSIDGLGISREEDLFTGIL
jgi:F420-0:gamma-glutamyl ligase